MFKEKIDDLKRKLMVQRDNLRFKEKFDGLQRKLIVKEKKGSK